MAKEKRLIDVNNVEFAVQGILNRESGIPLAVAEWLANIVRNAPTVDAVEVVRCKDCEHWNELKGKDSGKPVGYGYCRNGCGINGIAYEDSFCSYGERRTDG